MYIGSVNPSLPPIAIDIDVVRHLQKVFGRTLPAFVTNANVSNRPSPNAQDVDDNSVVKIPLGPVR